MLELKPFIFTDSIFLSWAEIKPNHQHFFVQPFSNYFSYHVHGDNSSWICLFAYSQVHKKLFKTEHLLQTFIWKITQPFFWLGNLQWISNKPSSYTKQFWIQKLVTTGRESNEGYPNISIIKLAPSVPKAKLQILVINYFSGKRPTQTLFFLSVYLKILVKVTDLLLRFLIRKVNISPEIKEKNCISVALCFREGQWYKQLLFYHVLQHSFCIGCVFDFQI